MKLRSYSKIKIVEKELQEYEWISHANAKAYSDPKEMEINPSTHGFVDEGSVMESMGMTSMQ